jgi:H+/Cl- antiporter ClcA
VAAGFGAVFGTPLTGAIFAIEVLAIGRMSYEALWPCLIGGIVGDCATGAWGIGHTQYHVTTFAALGLKTQFVAINWILLLKVFIAAIAFGLASVLFTELTHGISRLFKRLIPAPVVRPTVGGMMIIGLVYLLGTRDYLGLGVTTDPHTPGGVSILSCFETHGAAPLSWWWKTLFTAITLGSGFKGGEVTPLFFVGAALGNTMAHVLGAPVDLLAALGFVAVFAGATNTPLACTVMAIELFGKQPGLVGTGFVSYAAVACFVAYLLSGHSGIYLSQRISTPKRPIALPANASLQTLRDH